MLSRRALTPLVATILLVVFALIIGTATMSWGIKNISNFSSKEGTSFGSSIVIMNENIDSPLKELQIKYITGNINLDEYLQQEKVILEKVD